MPKNIRLWLYTALALGFGLQGIAAGLLISFRQFEVGLCAHFVSLPFFLIAYFLILRFGRRSDPIRPLFLYATLLISFFPLVGTLCALILFLMVKGFGERFKKGLFEDYEQYINERTPENNILSNYRIEMDRIKQEVSFEPLTDIMSGRKVSLKIKAITKLAQSFTVENIKLLRVATRDESPEVRLYAANALLQLEDDMNKAIQKLDEVAELSQTAPEFQALADRCRLYATSTLLEKTMMNHYLQLSFAAYEKAIRIDEEQKEYHIAAAEVLLELNDIEKAKKMMDQACERWGQDSRILFLRSKVYFLLGDYSEVSKQWESLSSQGVEKELMEVQSFWKK